MLARILQSWNCALLGKGRTPGLGICVFMTLSPFGLSRLVRCWENHLILLLSNDR